MIFSLIGRLLYWSWELIPSNRTSLTPPLGRLNLLALSEVVFGEPRSGCSNGQECWFCVDWLGSRESNWGRNRTRNTLTDRGQITDHTQRSGPRQNLHQHTSTSKDADGTFSEGHMTPTLTSLRWPPIKSRTDVKVLLLTHEVELLHIWRSWQHQILPVDHSGL